MLPMFTYDVGVAIILLGYAGILSRYALYIYWGRHGLSPSDTILHPCGACGETKKVRLVCDACRTSYESFIQLSRKWVKNAEDLEESQTVMTANVHRLFANELNAVIERAQR